jgi:Ohr subfamily peroxiredoxin
LGYSACFHSAIKFVAQRDKLDTTDSEVSCTVGIGFSDAGTGFGLEVELDVLLPNLDRDAATALVDRAHQACPYSNATRGNVDVKLNLVE